MAPATLMRNRKYNLGDGFIVEITIWRLPKRSPEGPHGLKYSLFYGNQAGRIVGYDNELGKGDHRHYRDREERHVFRSVPQLLSDFWTDVRKEHG